MDSSMLLASIHNCFKNACSAFALDTGKVDTCNTERVNSGHCGCVPFQKSGMVKWVLFRIASEWYSANCAGIFYLLRSDQTEVCSLKSSEKIPPFEMDQLLVLCTTV